LAVSARFLFSNSLETFVLSVILQFAVEAVFSIPVGIVSWSGVALEIVGVFGSGIGRSIGGGERSVPFWLKFLGFRL